MQFFRENPNSARERWEKRVAARLVRAITESSHNEDAGRVFYAAGREPIYSVDSLRIVVRG